MPYKHEETLEIPDDDKVVWRYFSKFDYFKNQIFDNVLTFTRDCVFPDPNEGRFTRKFEQTFQPTGPTNQTWPTLNSLYGPTICMGNPDGGGTNYLLNRYQNQIRKMFIVNCWTIKKSESLSMWVRYAGIDEKNLKNKKFSGLAIKSTVKKLKECFDNEVSNIFIAKISYKDYESYDFMKGQQFQTHLPLIHKMEIFEDESELRVFTVDPSFVPDPPINTPLEKCLKLDQTNPEVLPDRINIQTDFSKLIDKIVIAPSPEENLFSKVQDLLIIKDLDIPIETSKIDLPHAFS